jgi:predicted CXXCH cytochrome family protein
MFCHSAYPQLLEKSDRYGQESVFSQVLPSGIDCQRCHGPGSLHVGLASRSGNEVGQVRQAIVNPARLGSERQLEVCMQCHLETTSGSLGNHVQRFGRSVYSFRPGEPLGNYIVHFDLVDPTSGRPKDRFEIDGSAYRLRQSACFQKSNGRLTCTTCHDAHQTPSGAEIIRHFRKICLSCHDQLSTAEHAVPETINCVKCHMPERRTEDVVHVTMTDHFIQRNLPQRNLIAPLKEDHSVKREKVVLHLPQVLPPSEKDLYWGIAQIQSKSNLNEWMTRLKAALERDKPSVPEPYVELALAQIEKGRLDEAKANLRRALKMDPNLVIAHYKLGEALRKQSRLEEAEGRYRQVFRIEQDHTEAHNSLGIILTKQQPDLAIEHFRKALRRNPQFVEAYTNLGITCLRLGKLEEAIDAFKMAIRVKPGDSEAHNMFGLASIKLGRLQDAINAFELAVRINPDNAGAHYNLGTTYLILGEKPSALKQYEELRNLDKERADRLLDQINPKNGGRENEETVVRTKRK